MIAGSLSYRAHEEREIGFLYLFKASFPRIEVVGLHEGHDDAGRNRGLSPDTRALADDGTMDAVISQCPQGAMLTCVRVFPTCATGATRSPASRRCAARSSSGKTCPEQQGLGFSRIHAIIDGFAGNCDDLCICLTHQAPRIRRMGPSLPVSRFSL